MLRERGDMLVLNSELIHAGGVAAPGMRVRFIAFAAFGTHAYDYNLTNPVARPLWGYRPQLPGVRRPRRDCLLLLQPDAAV